MIGRIQVSVVGKVFCKILNNRLVQCLDKGGALCEGQAGFIKVAWIVFTLLCKSGLGRIKKHVFFLDVQKAYDTVMVRWFVVKIAGHGCKGEDVACN